MKKVYFMLADGFEETEFTAPWDLLLRAGADVVTFSVSGSEYVTGAHGLTVRADKPISELNADCDLIVLPGGGKGTQNLAASEKVTSAVRTVYANGGFVAAICAAPTVLASLGLLDGIEAICFPGMENLLGNAVISKHKVVRSGRIITAAAMGVSLEFGLALVSALFGSDVSEAVAKQTVTR